MYENEIELIRKTFNHFEPILFGNTFKDSDFQERESLK